ncbi:NUDIX hydrolase [Aquibacillus rhizosphaerae]|uniref:NUDIX hydrolase n=1 Tax=Aquibacillus rhizosphaerae TaxID=3051431 RepID=A0ABT7L5H7_9BACI|nr:NUDIX hydrolase [Aquibacillus sp. LR5S19]MDL4841109.1 NUDIX hydrolase [Aquibacillus sp. LR5S19]
MANYIADLRKDVGSRPIIMVGAGIMVFNSQGELLLQLRTDSNDWGLPGGAMELGESFEETAKRELLEETGLTTSKLDFVELLSGEHLYFKYPNDDEVYNVIALFKTNKVSGELQLLDGESHDLKYFSLKQLPEPIHKVTKIMIEAYYQSVHNARK